MYFRQNIETPLGKMIAIADHHSIVALYFEDATFKFDFVHKLAQSHRIVDEANPIIEKTKHQVNAFINGELRTFTIPFSVEFGTPFQQKVWHTVKSIPYGSTVTYQDIANRIQKVDASKAVITATNQNHLQILIPSHRVTNLDGDLNTFNGGIDKQSALIQIEQNPSEA
ncbi:methylated-DNA--[protein]-cysteine S-methyltransferase [Staphylococcus massiliensis]|uniref:Methylated-DNA--protein-cysteine methyltransferase n=1 Tax=Staphylococcus massiliensis S46 TaxID=1229783 RepID=K9AE92_9STAP|nr:methylated-DNA--[protein]-cysteine S-methyltransferase [Staphylococcus massiliensis]EKU45593.1 methylated-DNA--protein-cysteine methyltransferase [Staphylococcus massiliensis S46]MCG3399897.1 methylated-DNA--[protein]-cysteine S-methyltransferase [Staphylococcus massiliensis]MCG3402616.1 methylated-DNA--[protein]-cysteine S-methyltransferase [Staphylococcus massiliensis]MCG3413084.1 methylated-DNA--[protein]-cysteine S-methyltransferase [Staphylococcus massiliensis]PNZ98355.1 methylated-DNA